MSVQINTVLRHLRGVVFEHDQARLTDGQLLGRFIEQRDEAAVAALVRRHGAMVWGVCRRILHNHHDAEDAFQATFLILVRKAPSVRQRELVGNWLYGVAQQTAMKARATAGKRRTREMPITMTPEARPVTTDSDVHAVLDAELSRLPDRYRAAIVLCDLHGKTRKAAARQLGIPEGTVAGHLTRGRALLARRLARRGLAISGASLAAALTQTSASAGAPAALVLSTIKAMAIVAAGEAATELISIKVAALTEGVLKAMFLSKLKTTVGISLVAGLVVFGSMFAYRTQAADSSAPSSPTPKDRLTDTLILLDKQWWEAASKYDVDTLDKILAEDWTGGDWNKAKSLEHYRHSRYTEVKILTERRVVRLDEHAALMSYEGAADSIFRPRSGHSLLGSARWRLVREVHRVHPLAGAGTSPADIPRAERVGAADGATSGTTAPPRSGHCSSEPRTGNCAHTNGAAAGRAGHSQPSR